MPLNTRFKGGEARYVLERADVKLLFTVTDFLDTNYEALLRAEPELPQLREIIDLRGAGVGATSSRATPAPTLPDTLTGDDLCAILFTSGTTGRPKGAMLTHGATVRAYDAWSTVVGLRAGDRYLVVNPFFHSFGFNAGIVASLVKGATIIPHAVFDVDAVMTRAAEEHVSMLPGTADGLPVDPRPSAPRRVRHVVAAARGDGRGRRARRADPAHARRARLRDDRHRLRPHRGDGHRDDVPPRRRPRDDRDHLGPRDPRRRGAASSTTKSVEVPRGEPGEVVIRGYNVMRGFIHDPEATAEAIDADGWLHTGDVAVMDERGYIRITDRTKDMFIVGGFNAYPAEIENMINEHPAVGQVAVVGVPDERMGEVGYAYVIPRLNATHHARRAAARGAARRWPTTRCRATSRSSTTFPLNASGKVLKYELRERARAKLG